MFIKCILPLGKRILKLLHCQNEVSRNDCFDCHSCIRTGSFNMWESHAGMIENIWAHRYSGFHLLLQGGIPGDPKFILRRGECYRVFISSSVRAGYQHHDRHIIQGQKVSFFCEAVPLGESDLNPEVATGPHVLIFQSIHLKNSFPQVH